MKGKRSGAQGCPCGGPDYASCCGRFHRGEAQPGNAEQLMRSRYSAYVLNDLAWLRETWHPATYPPELDADLESHWLGLAVKAHTQQDDTHAEVEFVARFKRGGRAYRLHERSRFVREPRRAGEPPRWLYLDGEMLEQP